MHRPERKCRDPLDNPSLFPHPPLHSWLSLCCQTSAEGEEGALPQTSCKVLGFKSCPCPLLPPRPQWCASSPQFSPPAPRPLSPPSLWDRTIQAGSPEPKLLQNSQLSPHPFFKTVRQRVGEDEAPIPVFEMKFGAQRDTCTACNVQPWTSRDHQLLKKPHPSKRKAFLKATVAAEPPWDWLIIWFKSQY